MLIPESEQELSDILSTGTSPFRIIGGGTRFVPEGNGELLSARALSGVSLYEPGALTLVVAAGTPMSEIETLLAEQGQRLAFEPMDHRKLLGSEGTPTIGGVVAANVSGPRRVQAGACRDFLLGVRYVDGQGRIVRNGGRVMKNVTGYDLVRLMAGSRGTLGVLTEVALKVLPEAEASGTLRLHGLSAEQGVQAMSAALGSPYDVNGAAWDGRDVLLRVEGFTDSVRYRLNQLRDWLRRFGEAEPLTSDTDSRAIWEDIRDVGCFAGREGEVWRISVRPQDAPLVIDACPGCEAVLDWGGGLIWLLVPAGASLTATDIRAALPNGHATRVRGTHGVDSLHPSTPPVAALEAGIRKRFDPAGRLNPGMMGG